MSRALVARLDNVGDVLLTGPAVRAVAASSEHVTFLASPHGREAAELLPGVDEVLTFDAPWISAEPPPADPQVADRVIEEIRSRSVDRALIFTSFHQSPLPLALLLRFAGVAFIGAISVDYPGSLLDVRHRVSDDVHEVERALSLADACGYDLPPGDDGRLTVELWPPSLSEAPGVVAGERTPEPSLPADYVVVHPGASVPARTWSPLQFAATVDALRARGHHVVVTGSRRERPLAATVAGPYGPGVTDLAGDLDLLGLARTLAGALTVVAGNTGPAHLAAAVGAPVVSLFPPTVPAARWRPWRVPHVLLGDQEIHCAGCRAKVCPFDEQRCISRVTVSAVVNAVELLARQRRWGRPRVALPQRADRRSS